MKYNKPSLTIEEQIALLQARGMRFTDVPNARHQLSHIGYYRLRAYWFPFELDNKTHQLVEGTTFEQSLSLYQFDRSLRNMVFDALQLIEISVRTQWTYHFSQHFGPFGYLNPAHAKSFVSHDHNIEQLTAEVGRSDEAFIQHFVAKYDEHTLPPIWMASELMSFGALSKWYKNTQPGLVRKDIARAFGVDNRQLDGILANFVFVRNLCAHHSRLWNHRMISMMPEVRGKPHGLRASMNREQPRKLYNSLVMVAHFVDVIKPDNRWKMKFRELVAKYDPDVSAMGAPSKWYDLPVWTQ